jgi:pyridoxal phosphate enzyme (YggS family)
MSDLQWHFIGHLQTNKLKMVLPYVSLVQSVDSLRLLEAIQGWASANDRKVSVLLEPHVAAEESKQGFSPKEIYDILSSADKYPDIAFRGIMGMATFTDDQTIIRSDFATLRDIFDKSRLCLPSDYQYFTELSIGMSDDYPIAVEYGSTIVRIGSMIFGERV